MEINRFIELSCSKINPWPVYREDLTHASENYWLDQTYTALQNIVPASEQLLLRNPFNKWCESTHEGVFEEARNYIEGFGKRSINTSSGITHMELRLFNSFQLPVMRNQPHKKLLDLFTIEQTRLGDGTAYYDKNSQRWGVTQKHGVRHYKSHFMVISIEKGKSY